MKRMRRWRQAAVVGIALVALGAHAYALVQGWHGGRLVVLDAALIACSALAMWPLWRSELVPNALEQWREFRVVRSFLLQASDGGGCEITCELGQESSPGHVVTLRCRGVQSLRVAQFFGGGLSVGELFAETLPPNRRDGMRFLVRDGAGDRDSGIAFLCRSFDVA